MGIEQTRDDHRDDTIPFWRSLGGDELLQPKLTERAEHGGDMSMRQ